MTRKLTFAESFGCGAVSGVGATCVVHPMDVLRVRLQLDAEGGGIKVLIINQSISAFQFDQTQPLQAFRGPWHCATSIVKAQGVTGLYAGFSAGIARQIGTTACDSLRSYCLRNRDHTACDSLRS